MKKITISFIAIMVLIMNGISQNYELTESYFKQKFDDPQLDKAGEFTWTKTQGGDFTIDETEGVLTVSRAFVTYSDIILTFETPIDLSAPNPWITFDAKADADSLLLVVQFVDADGNHTSTQHKTYVSTEWETHGTFSFFPMWDETNASEIKSVKITRFNKDEHSSNLYLKNFFVGTKDFTIGTQYTLDATPTAGGDIILDPAGGKYDDGTVVTAIAVADDDYKFDSWSGESSATTDTIEITMDADKSLTANFIFSSSIAENTHSSAFTLYPVPAQNTLYIGIEDNTANIKGIKVNDIAGKTLIEIQDENIQQIDLSGLKKGIYILSCTTDIGTINKIFVKE